MTEEQKSQDLGNGITGYVKPEYMPVIDYWKKLYKIDQDKRGQVCAYVGNECVIDVSMNNEKDKYAYNADSITTIWSSGKNVAATLIAIMVDQGLVNYESPVAEYWPEFAQNNKETIRICDVLRHEAGMHKFAAVMKPEDSTTDKIKENKLGELIEKEEQHYVDKEKFPCYYHAL